MNKFLKKLLESNIDLVESNDFENLYKLANKTGVSTELTVVLQQAGIDPLQYMDKIPSRYASGFTNYQFDIPDHITEIGDEAFMKSSLKEITIKSACNRVRSSAFAYSNLLETVNFESGCIKIDSGAFFNCSFLKTVNLPETLLSLGESVFFEDYYLEQIKLPSFLAGIGRDCFGKCGLTEIFIPKSVTDIEARAFQGCSNLRKVTILGGDTIYNGVFRRCNKLESVMFGNDGSDFDDNIFDNENPPKHFYVPKTNQYVLDYCGKHNFNVHLI